MLHLPLSGLKQRRSNMTKLEIDDKEEDEEDSIKLEANGSSEENNDVKLSAKLPRYTFHFPPLQENNSHLSSRMLLILSTVDFLGWESSQN